MRHAEHPALHILRLPGLAALTGFALHADAVELAGADTESSQTVGNNASQTDIVDRP